MLRRASFEQEAWNARLFGSFTDVHLEELPAFIL
jgi:hypothetical protein